MKDQYTTTPYNCVYLTATYYIFIVCNMLPHSVQYTVSQYLIMVSIILPHILFLLSFSVPLSFLNAATGCSIIVYSHILSFPCLIYCHSKPCGVFLINCHIVPHYCPVSYCFIIVLSILPNGASLPCLMYLHILSCHRIHIQLHNISLQY